MMDAIREGVVNKTPATAPSDLVERSNHLKAFGYFQDTSMVGMCKLPKSAVLNKPTRNPDIDRLAHDIRTKQTKTLASGIDQIMAGLKDSIEAPLDAIDHHTHAIVLLVEHHRDPKEHEPGADWIMGHPRPSRGPTCDRNCRDLGRIYAPSGVFCARAYGHIFRC